MGVSVPPILYNLTRYVVIIARQTAMSAGKLVRFARTSRTPPSQPDYPDELTPEQLDAIRRLAGTDTAKERQLLYSPAW